MKSPSIFRFALLFGILLILSSRTAYGQLHWYTASIDAGASSFSANTPSLTGYLLSCNISVQLKEDDYISYEAGYLYTRNLDILFPEIRTGKFYGYIHGVQISAALEQKTGGIFFLRESLGFVYLQDKTLPESSKFSPGITAKFILGAVISSRRPGSPALYISAGVITAVTLLHTTPGFNGASISLGYFFDN